MNALHRYCRARFRRAGVPVPPASARSRTAARAGSTRLASAAPTATAASSTRGALHGHADDRARAAEAEVKFAQGAKPGKGGHCRVRRSPHASRASGAASGYELVSPPVNHNLYSIEDVKLMVESWRHLNPDVNAALKFVATHGVEMACMGGSTPAPTASTSRTAAGNRRREARRQKHGGVPVPAVLPRSRTCSWRRGPRAGGGERRRRRPHRRARAQADAARADRVGFGLAPDGGGLLDAAPVPPRGPAARRPDRQAPARLHARVATQDPALVARFTGRSQHVTRLLRHVAGEVRSLMARNGIRRLSEVIGRRDLLEKRPDLGGKAALLDVGTSWGRRRRAPRRGTTPSSAGSSRRSAARPRRRPPAGRGRRGGRGPGDADQRGPLRGRGRGGGSWRGASATRTAEGAPRPAPPGAAATSTGVRVHGMELYLQGLAADSCFTAAYAEDRGGAGGADTSLTSWATPSPTARARAGYVAGRRQPLRHLPAQEPRGRGARVVVEGVEANAFQYMTGGVALVLGPVGFNLGAGLTGGRVYLLDPDGSRLNRQYVRIEPLDEAGAAEVAAAAARARGRDGEPDRGALLSAFDPERFARS